MKIGAYPFRVLELTYLDHAATTPMRPEAVEAMLPFLTERFANPSGSHRAARDARKASTRPATLVAAALGCRPGEVVFTGGGTEADNLAVLGRAGGPRRRRGVLGRRAPRRAAPGRARWAAASSAGRRRRRVDLDALAAALDDGRVASCR